MNHYKYICFISFFLSFLVVSCLNGKKERFILERQTIQEANRKEIDKNNTPFDQVYINKDTLFYWKNNEYKGKTVIIKGNDINNESHSEEQLNSEFNKSEAGSNRKTSLDSVYIQNDTMYYWRNNKLKGKTVIIRGDNKNKKH